MDRMPTLLQRLARIAPYFRDSRSGFGIAMLAAVVGAATEPAIPALMQPLLDRGFGGQGLPLWLIPLAIVVLFAIRGSAGFVEQYMMSWGANRGVLQLREAMFDHLLRAAPGLFTRHSASSLTNTLVYEVQQGANLLVGALLTLVRDSLTLLALLGYLLWLNWKLTLVVAVLAPAVGIVMRIVSRRLHRLVLAGQKATDELAYVVEENVLAWRIVRLHGARRIAGRAFLQDERPAAPADAQVGGRGRHDVADHAAAGCVRAVHGDRRRAVAERRRRHHGGQLRRVHHRDADAAHAAEAPVQRHHAAHARHGRAGARGRAGRGQPGRAGRQPSTRAARAARWSCATSRCATATTAIRRWTA